MNRSGRKSAAQTPAPLKERIYGSKKNPKGSAESKSSALSISLSDSIVSSLEKKKDEFNEKYPTKKVSLPTLKAIMRRGMGAYSKSHRPTITGGAPNSRQAWAFARVNKFLEKKAGKKVKAAYVQDDDLMANGGEIELLKPNGKKSNLTPEQYKLVRTPQFKAWFGDWENDPENASKVVDENGEPMVVWHYARRLQYELDKFFVFRTTKQLGSHFGSLNQISNLSTDAKYNIDKNDLDFRFYEVFLNIRNPIRMKDTSYWENQDLLNALSEKYDIYEQKEWQNGETYAKYYAQKYGIDGITYLNRYEIKAKDWAIIEANQIKEEKLTDKEFQKLVPSAEYSWIAFNPNQIKLADGTNTTFDANNPDIRYKDGGEIGKDITCVNCGHSWNTSNSEEYDKYVCHKCGFDNRTFYDADFVGESKKKIALPDTYTSFDILKPILEKQGYTINKNEMELPVGKLAKGMNLSEVAAVHGLEADALKSELIEGIEREMEHTDKPEYARAIALDHLYEDPKYYTKMKKMEGMDKHLESITKKYAEGGKIDEIFSFKTPTGEKSKLNYVQQVLVRTTAFKNWFGDWEKAAIKYLSDGKENFEKHYQNVSKVLDYVTLEPRVLYHGTRVDNEFFVFDATREAGVGRPYGYFAHNIEYSQNFTISSQRGHSSTKPYLYSVFVNIRNPFMALGQQYEAKSRDADSWLNVITGTISWDKYKTMDRNEFTIPLEMAVKSQIGKYSEQTFGQEKAAFWRLMARDIDKTFKSFLISYGYDGVFYTEEFTSPYDIDDPAQFTQAVTIFDSNQVKLADGRNLNFDPLKVDIRYDEGGQIDENSSPIQNNDMNKKEHLRNLLLGGDKFAEGGKIVAKDSVNPNDGKKGGYFKGRSHAEGGIKAYNVDTGQHIEVEGEEVIITKGAVNDPEKREFEGEMLTNREILSKINQSGGGVAFEDGGEIKGHECGCSGKKYKYGGELMEDFNIMRKMNEPYNLAQRNLQQARSFVDDLVSKMS